MGWANCGEDSKGRPIGYAHSATCDHPGCNEKIDRGISYACGTVMHGACDWSCEGYFCYCHQLDPDVPSSIHRMMSDDGIYGVCHACCKVIEDAWKRGSFDDHIPADHRYGIYNEEDDEGR